MNNLEWLEQRTSAGWLAKQDNLAFLALVQTLCQEFGGWGTAPRKSPGIQSILIAESDPTRFLAAFLAAHATVLRVFLGNPQWGTTEWQQAVAIAQPDYIWGNIAPVVKPLMERSRNPNPILPDSPLILIPTGGTSGSIRFVMHRWETLAAAVRGLQQYFQLETVNSICVLPLYHVSGLMQAMRSLLSDGQLWLMPFKTLKLGQTPAFLAQNWCISLVPTQLHALLQCPKAAQWLTQCHTVFIGGAPPWPDLLQQARTHCIPLSLCYGMTETAAQFTALYPQDFLAGQQNLGQVMPHAQVVIVDEKGRSLPPQTIGQVCVASESLALGYYPTGWSSEQIIVSSSGVTAFCTDDGGYFDAQGHLTLVGRFSSKIITGGENVFPSEVEAAIWATGWVMDVAVVGIPDDYWGQCVVAVYVPKDNGKRTASMVFWPKPAHASQRIAALLHDKIARYKHPKVWIPVDEIPRNAQGKVNRHLVEAMGLSYQQANARQDWLRQWLKSICQLKSRLENR